jgi:type IV pilus assembly protein PilC
LGGRGWSTGIGRSGSWARVSEEDKEMPVYTYKGTNKAGANVSGEMSATSKSEAQNQLRRQQITTKKMSEKGKEFNMPTFGGSVSAKELAIFTRQFSVMIDAGLPLVQCLEILAGQQENKLFQKVLAGTRASVEGGATLSAAMRQHPKVFDSLYVNMVEAGETGGILDTILQRLSTYIEKNVKLKRAVQSASIYPIGVMTIAGGVVTLLLWKVVPIFATLFAGLGVDLPLPTKIVIALSNFIGSIFGLLIVMGVVGSVIAIKVWYGTEQGRYVIDSIVLKLPILGLLMRKIAVARFTRTLGTLIASGVPILEGLDITAKTAGNAVVERALQKVRKSLEEGKSLTEPLKDSEVFPGMVTQMISVGEQTGAMDAMLQKIADFYEEEVDAAVKDLLTALEPIMIVFLGVVVGGVVISMYMPLFSLIGKLSGK